MPVVVGGGVDGVGTDCHQMAIDGETCLGKKNGGPEVVMSPSVQCCPKSKRKKKKRKESRYNYGPANLIICSKTKTLPKSPANIRINRINFYRKDQTRRDASIY